MDSPDRQARDEPELQLPDLDVVVRSFQAIADELPKFRNIPAFDVGAAILTEMREMRLETRRNNNLLDSRLKAMEVNNVARLINSTLMDADGQLSPLRNVATNELIDQFPATPRTIRDMNSATLDTVLRPLGWRLMAGSDKRGGG